MPAGSNAGPDGFFQKSGPAGFCLLKRSGQTFVRRKNPGVALQAWQALLLRGSSPYGV